MKDWYALTNDLDTPAAPLDDLARARVQQRVKAALPRRRRRVSMITVIAAVLLLTACGVAVATGQFSQWFWNISEDRLAPEASEELFAELGTVIGQSQTAGGVTMTLDGALWDGEYMYLSLTVEGLELANDSWVNVESKDSWLGASYERTRAALWASFYAMTEAEQQQNGGAEGFAEHIETAWETTRRWKQPDISYVWNRSGDFYRLQVRREITANQNTLPAELTLHLENLSFNEVVLEDVFEFTFSLEPKPMECLYGGDVVFKQENFPDVRIRTVRVTPFQVELEFTSLDETALEGYDVLGGMKIRNLRAGETEVGGASSTGLRTEDDGSGRTHYTLTDGPFRQIVDPRTVTAVEINGTLLDLSQFTLQG